MCGPTTAHEQENMIILPPQEYDQTDHEGTDEDEEMEIYELRVTDVLFGRGNGVAAHPGNRNFREIVKAHKKEYQAAPRHCKTRIAGVVVAKIGKLDPPGRFLEPVADGRYLIVSQSKALEKTSQALREKTAKSSANSSPRPSSITSDDRASLSSHDESVTLPFERLDYSPTNDGIMCYSDSVYFPLLRTIHRPILRPALVAPPVMVRDYLPLTTGTLQQRRPLSLPQHLSPSPEKDYFKGSEPPTKPEQTCVGASAEATATAVNSAARKRKHEETTETDSKCLRDDSISVEGQFEDANESIVSTSLSVYQSYLRQKAYDVPADPRHAML